MVSERSLPRHQLKKTTTSTPSIDLDLDEKPIDLFDLQGDPDGLFIDTTTDPRESTRREAYSREPSSLEDYGSSCAPGSPSPWHR
jgi:hypothetical protein